ncbi:MAG: YfiR family protein [Methylococcaceae bacterium]
MNKYVSQIVLFILLISSIFNSVSFADEAQNLEYKLKALYIIRLSKFIIWPESPNKNSFKICIDSKDQVAIQLKKTTKTDINGRKLEIIDPPVDFSIAQCDFLYFSSGLIDSAIVNIPVVTISSHKNFAEQGGMIEFYIDDSKVRMKANLQVVNRAGIKLSSKLIRLLKIVKQLEVRDE